MAAVSQQAIFEEGLLCAICLELFTDPVTIPCGHNFCLECIKRYWDKEASAGVSSCCPKCRAIFPERPQLSKNTVLCDLVRNGRPSERHALPESDCHPVSVACDFCVDQEFKAVKSCSVCAASFCQIHVKPHQTLAELLHHPLTDLVKGNGSRQCERHDRLLELFCRTDQTFICCMCAIREHRYHVLVTVQEERAEQDRWLLAKRAELEKVIQATDADIRDLTQQTDRIPVSAVKVNKVIAGRFSELARAVEEAQERVATFIAREEQAALRKTRQAIGERKRRSAELARRKDEMEELSQNVDDVSFLQALKIFSSERETASARSNCEVHLSFAGVNRVVADLKERLRRKCDEISGSLTGEVAELRSYWPLPTELGRNRSNFLACARQLTFDSKTTHKHLSLSKENRKVLNIWPKEAFYVNHTERFDSCWQVLCMEHFERGAHYWEVEISEGSLAGVTYKSIPRKGTDSVCFIGKNSLSWGLQSFSDHCLAWHNGTQVKIKPSKHERLGVHLDYSAGQLSFYGINHTMTLIHQFQAVFTEPLYPAFRLIKAESFCCISPIDP
ncbi:E3 ubiquitin/ISG15 ligase TRIM25-like [Callorhinchus milii]|uniref:E3 ubiquitin/ISG15 ligase TRIM25-like n=1 Tax=Callorhinchus milii TaxID=7868 RepID=UPI001C3F7708|nr:E3 ubiquitin/ISG15 ligase TRIM25-like [Callorhinchus milii]